MKDDAERRSCAGRSSIVTCHRESATSPANRWRSCRCWPSGDAFALTLHPPTNRTRIETQVPPNPEARRARSLITPLVDRVHGHAEQIGYVTGSEVSSGQLG